jgi:VIT1/CCC1 family predicted Fe2+/Mn2+ transporter
MVVRDSNLSSGPIDFLFAAVMLVIATTLLWGALIGRGRPSSPRRRPVYLLLGVLGVAVWFLARLLFG